MFYQQVCGHLQICSAAVVDGIAGNEICVRSMTGCSAIEVLSPQHEFHGMISAADIFLAAFFIQGYK